MGYFGRESYAHHSVGSGVKIDSVDFDKPKAMLRQTAFSAKRHNSEYIVTILPSNAFHRYIKATRTPPFVPSHAPKRHVSIYQRIGTMLALLRSPERRTICHQKKLSIHHNPTVTAIIPPANLKMATLFPCCAIRPSLLALPFREVERLEKTSFCKETCQRSCLEWSQERREVGTVGELSTVQRRGVIRCCQSHPGSAHCRRC